MKLLSKFFAIAALAVATQTFAADWASGSTDWDKLPEVKKSKVGLYLTPQQAHDMKKNNPQGVAFFDIRTRAEAMYVGMSADVDGLVPYVEHAEIMSDWDEKRGSYQLEPNSDFVPEVDRRLTAMGLAKDATIILMCRSGDRSAKAQDLLLQAGYRKVYGVAEGFEGDAAKEGPKAGQRVINGWKNAGLPWAYKLDKAKMYFPR